MSVAQAVILAAGRGSRMGGLTEAVPKCLVRLAGRTLLDWQLDALRQAGIHKISVVRGYRPECLAGPDYQTIDNPAWAETNMVSSLCCASALLESGQVIVSYADIAYAPGIVRRLADAPGDIALTYDSLWLDLWRQRFADPVADAETFRVEAGRVVEIGQRIQDLSLVQGQYMGLVKWTPAGWRTAQRLLQAMPDEAVRKLDMTGFLGRLIASGVTVTGVPVRGGWCEVDSEADLRRYEQLLAAGGWSHDWRQAGGGQ